MDDDSIALAGAEQDANMNGIVAIPLTFPEVVKTSGVRIDADCLEEFRADPVGWAFNQHDPDNREDKAWLNANAPGWSMTVKMGKSYNCELPVGRDPVGTFLGFELMVHFTSAAHRDAWRARRVAQHQEAIRLREHIKAREAAAKPGEEVCAICGGTMAQETKSETYRLAQLAFTYQDDQWACPDCGGSMFRAGRFAVISEAMDALVARVGLPDGDSPRWTPEIGTEWRRRSDAPPDVEIVIDDGMTPDALVAALDIALGKSAPFRPVLVVG